MGSPGFAQGPLTSRLPVAGLVSGRLPRTSVAEGPPPRGERGERGGEERAVEEEEEGKEGVSGPAERRARRG